MIILGDIAFRFLDHVKQKHGPNNTASVTVLDINPSMLQVGVERASRFGYDPASPGNNHTSSTI
jgi:ubiquinone/menaquinone biosynthesis C-methylase UbiE